jgi:hypothetical protein
MRVDTSLLQGITAANQANQTSTASLKSTGTTTSFSSQLKAASEKETTRAIPGANYAEILTGPRAGMYLNTGGGTRDGQAFVLVKHDGREDHIYGTGSDRKVVTVGAGASESTDSSSSASDTNVKTSTPTGSSPTSDSSSGKSDKATTDKAPANEKTKAVAGHAYADITSGPRKDLYINTSGNARDGKTFVLVRKDDREYHIYGTGKDREVFSVKVKDDAATSTDAGTTSSSDTTTGAAASVGSATSV